jgi:hypothetical protein
MSDFKAGFRMNLLALKGGVLGPTANKKTPGKGEPRGKPKRKGGIGNSVYHLPI